MGSTAVCVVEVAPGDIPDRSTTELPSVRPSPTPRETLPPVSLAGSRDPFSIPPGLELSTGGSVSPVTTVATLLVGDQSFEPCET
ncbi:MAG TPA: hypothetical protein VFU18_04380 [Actinomycetota bacterium]|nr:hypothetical protein [Actinomycetota bacterium]